MSSHIKSRGVVVRVVALAALLIGGAERAFAHAQLLSASPAAGSNVATAPNEVVVNFSESLEPAFSSVAVRDAAGNRVDKADSHIDQSSKTTMRVSLPSLGQGTYTVGWRAVTADTHRVDGKFTFHVGQ